MAEILAEAFGSIQRLKSADEETLSSLPGVGPRIASSVAVFFKDPHNRETVEKLTEAGVKGRIREIGDEAGSAILNGLSFVFTGELSGMTRPEAESLVKGLGASAPSSVAGRPLSW